MAETPVVKSLRAVPVAGRDCMLLNLSGAHGAFFASGRLDSTSIGNWLSP